MNSDHVGWVGFLFSGSSAMVAWFAHTLPILQWFAAAVAILAGSITIGSWIVKGVASWAVKSVKTELAAKEPPPNKHPTLK